MLLGGSRRPIEILYHGCPQRRSRTVSFYSLPLDGSPDHAEFPSTKIRAPPGA
jgi:hypothetical protein